MIDFDPLGKSVGRFFKTDISVCSEPVHEEALGKVQNWTALFELCEVVINFYIVGKDSEYGCPGGWKAGNTGSQRLRHRMSLTWDIINVS